jgi:hypothetical protein
MAGDKSQEQDHLLMINPDRRRAPTIELHFNTLLTTVATAGVLAVCAVLWQTYNEVQNVKSSVNTFPLIYSLRSEVTELRLEIERLKNELKKGRP